MKRGICRAALFAALCLAASASQSHDSWLSPARDDPVPGEVMLELATGNRYPVQEFSQSPASVSRARCTDGAATVPLRPLSPQPNWLDLAASAADGGPLSCWLELAPAEIEIEPRVVEIYFADIRAPAAIRETWAAMKSRGLRWHETFRKFARIELSGAAVEDAARVAAARRPAGLDLEIVILGERPVAAGQPMEFQVLRDGRPLAGFPVELVSERNAFGIWQQTDSLGKLRHTLPFGGRWLLRGTDLRLSAEHAGTWESRFVTLAIEAR